MEQAIKALDAAIKMSRSGLGRESKPVGSFLFSGPTGVGKTEIAKVLAQTLGRDLIRLQCYEGLDVSICPVSRRSF